MLDSLRRGQEKVQVGAERRGRRAGVERCKDVLPQSSSSTGSSWHQDTDCEKRSKPTAIWSSMKMLEAGGSRRISDGGRTK